MRMTAPDAPPIKPPPAEEIARPWFKSKWFNLTLGLIVTFASLGYALHLMADGKPLGDVFREIGRAFTQANYVSLLPMWVVLFVYYWLKAWRWRMLLAPLGDYRTSRLFPPTLIGFAFNNVLPAHLGEFVRVFVFARQSGQPKSAVLTTVAVERIFDVVAIFIFLGIGLTFAPDFRVDAVEATVLRDRAILFAEAAGLVLLVAAAYLIWPQKFVAVFEWCLDRVPLIPKGLRTTLADLLETGAAGLTSLKSGPLLTGIVVTSLLQWALNGLLVYLSLWSFGIHLSPMVSCIVLGVVAIGVSVPSSPGYFGVVQFCFLIVLLMFVPKEQEPAVMAASIYYHMVQWIPVTLLGMLYFVRSGLHVADIEDDVVEDEGLE